MAISSLCLLTWISSFHRQTTLYSWMEMEHYFNGIVCTVLLKAFSDMFMFSNVFSKIVHINSVSVLIDCAASI
jgi:hypothetical protein